MEFLANLVGSLLAQLGDYPLYPDHPLQEAQVRVITQEECRKRFAEVNITVPEEIICVDKLNQDDPPPGPVRCEKFGL